MYVAWQLHLRRSRTKKLSRKSSIENYFPMIGIYKEMGSNVTNFVLQKRTHVYSIGNTVNKFVIVIRARNTSPRF